MSRMGEKLSNILMHALNRLNGKPGSGKSTLMKYITSEFRRFYHDGASLPGWGTGANLVTCSFFFWTIGNPLQKNNVGFLRSLLYQIAEQREDFIPLMMGQDAMSEERMGSPSQPLRIYAWTKERLDDALRRFLSEKPKSIHVCFFIDGLDEFFGDEDLIMETLRLLSGTPRTHVCVSSRPEQIFRQGFKNSPQLRLQDFNHQDIVRTVNDRLNVTLKEWFPQSLYLIEQFMKDVVTRSEGVFLWTELITKDVRAGTRNSDSMQELRERFDGMPNTIEGLYEHMLSRLGKSYRREAARYFQLLMTDQSILDPSLKRTDIDLGLTLLDCACTEAEAWNHLLNHNLAYFESVEFQDSCCHLETRILTRCSGLVEISDHRLKTINGVLKCNGNPDDVKDKVHTSQDIRNVSRFLRQVRFIHKTVLEFLQGHEEFFQDPDWRMTAALALARGKFGVVSLTSIVLTQQEAYLRPLIIDEDFVLGLLSLDSCIKALWPVAVGFHATKHATIQLVQHAYKLLNDVSLSMNGSDYTLFNTISHKYGPSFFVTRFENDMVPFYNCLGFAAFFGRYDYVSNSLSKNRSRDDIEYVLSCCIAGLSSLLKHHEGPRRASLAIAGYFRIIAVYLHELGDTNIYIKTAGLALVAARIPIWTVFLDCSQKLVESLIKWKSMLSFSNLDAQLRYHISRLITGWKDTVACFLDLHADPNKFLRSIVYAHCSDELPGELDNEVSLIVKETSLAWIERMFAFIDPDFVKEMETLLGRHGGRSQRTVISLDLGKDRCFLTNEQSNCLLRAWVWEGGYLPINLPFDFAVMGVSDDHDDQELNTSDPTAERTLKLFLDNVARFKLIKVKPSPAQYLGFNNLDFAAAPYRVESQSAAERSEERYWRLSICNHCRCHHGITSRSSRSFLSLLSG